MYTRTDPYQSALVAAQQEFHACEQQLRVCIPYEQYEQQAAALRTRIARLKAAISALEELRGVALSGSVSGSWGDLVRAVLSANLGRDLTVTQIREVIRAMGIQFGSPENASSALNLTLRRLIVKPGSGIKANLQTRPMTFTWDVNVPLPSPQIPFPPSM